MKEKIINVVDAICGEGKSTALINYINSNKNRNEKFLYITPFLTEIDRVKKKLSFKKI